MNYRLEYRPWGRRRWRVVWTTHMHDLGPGSIDVYRTFRTRERAERFLERKTRKRRPLPPWEPVG